MAIEIPLSRYGKNKGIYVAIVDDIDRDLAETNWAVNVDNSTQYVRTRNLILHRVILSRILERELLPSEFPDHINGNGLDNRRENLRLASRADNNANRGKTKRNVSGYKGVSWNKSKGKYIAQISHNGKKIHLGQFDDPAKAYEAYCTAAKQYYGEFANFGDKE